MSATTVASLGAAVERLAAAGCDSPRLDAELLLAHALGVDRARLFSHPEHALPSERFERLLERRVAREPLAYITGRKAFRYLDLHVDRRVLIPRPETELLVEIALELPHGARVHDVGTGSGAIALAIKHERPDLVVTGSDISTDALAVASANASAFALDVRFELVDGLPARDYDLVVANLPYVRENEWDALEPEIRRYEPRTALVAGTDGVEAIRALVEGAQSATRFALEHAPEQTGAVRSLLTDAQTLNDLSGRERVSVGYGR